MTILSQLASSLGKRDDKPNQELASRVAQARDSAAVSELVAGLAHTDPALASDCIKTLYEIGYIDPSLIAPFVQQFLALLKSRNNRLVWGGMIALAVIAPLAHAELAAHVQQFMAVAKTGSVITTDNAIKALAAIAARQPSARAVVCPFLLEHLATCRPKEVAQHAEASTPALEGEFRARFQAVLRSRLTDLNPSAAARVQKILKKTETPHA